MYLLCCQCCLLLKHTQVQLHVLHSGSAVQRDSGLGVQQHPVLVHRRHIRRVIGGADELQAAQTEHQPGQHERHEDEHGVMWLGPRKRRGRIQRFIRRYPFHLKRDASAFAFRDSGNVVICLFSPETNKILF